MRAERKTKKQLIEELKEFMPVECSINVVCAVLLMVVIAVMGVSCTGVEKPAEPLEKVSMGISATSLLPTLVHIAEEKGYFLEEGIEIEIIGYPTGKAALAATFSGEVDMGTVADTPIVSNSFERNDFAVFVTILDSAQHAKVLARSDRNINAPQDLVGKKVATTLGTTAHFFMDRFFIVNSIDYSDLEIVDIKPGEMVEAITNGDVDAIFAWEPNIIKSQESLGDNAIVLPGDVGYLQTFSLVAKNEYIETNPELMRKIISALVKAEQFTNDNREESVDIIASRLETDRRDIDRLWGGYSFRLSLTQTLIVTLEDVARWEIRSNMTGKTEVPNYLDYIHIDALEEVAPDAISIIR